MFRKEILDTVRSLGVYVLVSAVITVISYAFIHFSSTLGLTYIEYLSFIIQIILLLLSFYLGAY